MDSMRHEWSRVFKEEYMTLQGRLQDYSLIPYLLKVKSHLKFIFELDISAS